MHARCWDRYYFNKLLKTVFFKKPFVMWGICDTDVPFIIYAIYSRCFERLQKKRPASLADKFIIILQKGAGCALVNCTVWS